MKAVDEVGRESRVMEKLSAGEARRASRMCVPTVPPPWIMCVLDQSDIFVERQMEWN